MDITKYALGFDWLAVVFNVLFLFKVGFGALVAIVKIFRS